MPDKAAGRSTPLDARTVAQLIKDDAQFRRSLFEALDERTAEDELRVVAHAYAQRSDAMQEDVIVRHVVELEKLRSQTSARSTERAVLADRALICARILSRKLTEERLRNERLTVFAFGVHQAGWISRFQLDLVLGVVDAN